MALFPKDRDLNETLEELSLAVDASAFREPAEGFQVRLDHFLAFHLRWRSRTSVQVLIRAGYVEVDAATPDRPQGAGHFACELRPGRRVGQGSKVRLTIPPESRRVIEGEASDELDVLYADEAVLAVDKPPLVAVHPSGRYFRDTLIQRVHARYRREIHAGEMAPRLCHRLDRETSGIVLVAKNGHVHPRLSVDFERRRVEKEYLAIVHGQLERDAGRIDLPLGQSLSSRIRLKMAVRAEGAPSRTDYQVEARSAGYSLVRCQLHTGRQHQIRVHLAAIGHAIVGDKLYGEDDGLFERSVAGELSTTDEERLELPRHALHHARLIFTTPAGDRPVQVESPLPKDLREFLETR